MEQLTILFEESEYDRLVHQSMMQASTVTFAFKDKATVSGKPGCVIAFDVQLPNGQIATAQATVTARSLAMVGEAMRGKFGDLLKN